MRRWRVSCLLAVAGAAAFLTAGCTPGGAGGGAHAGPTALPSYATVDLNSLGSVPGGNSYTEGSAAQQAELADGVVTYDEYKAAFDRMRACVQQQSGLDIVIQGKKNELIQMAIPGAADPAYETCYPKEFGFVDKAWGTYRENFSAEANAMAECLRERGVTPELTYMDRYNQLGALRMDPEADCVWKKIPEDAPGTPP